MERGLLGALGVGMALFGGTYVAYFANILAAGGDGRTTTSTAAGLVVFFAGMLAAGLLLAWRMFRPRPSASGAARPGGGDVGPAWQPDRSQNPGSRPPANAAEREHRVLRLAEKEHGRVTIPEVASRCNMTVQESKAELDRLVLTQIAEIQVTANGVLIYVFPGFLSDQEKSNATDF
jgi:hypothetical protein